jgi:hypothetical protein
MRRPGLDTGIAEILREEADREQAQRLADSQSGLESQPDLGLDAGNDPERQRNEEARRRMARMRGEAALPISSSASGTGSRGDLLPDIEEINSTLRSNAERDDGDDEPFDEAGPARQRSGFRSGFGTVVFVFFLLIALYLLAPHIIAAVPQTETVLNAYVGFVNEGRVWLDNQMQSLLDKMNATGS